MTKGTVRNQELDKLLTKTNTIVAGASAANLAAAACLKKEGIPHILLEKTARVASAWRRHYDRLHLHTNKSLSTLPYKSFPAHYPKYPSRDQVVAYLEAYANEFRLLPQFNQEVISAECSDGKWQTEMHDARYVSDNLVVATGYTHQPYKPAFEFVNGVQRNFDAVILATGYRPNVVAFLRNVNGVLDEHGKPRFSRGETRMPGLYFCGFYVSPTGMLREIGIEAKRIARKVRGDEIIE